MEALQVAGLTVRLCCYAVFYSFFKNKKVGKSNLRQCALAANRIFLFFTDRRKILSGKGGIQMPIELFAHNRQAYAQAKAMLAKTGKAAVIHPTGTGKSFIGFKLCEDHPSQRICWLSPSEYIFKTQLDNQRNMADELFDGNVASELK